jgi:hypothetical protein
VRWPLFMRIIALLGTKSLLSAVRVMFATWQDRRAEMIHGNYFATYI